MTKMAKIDALFMTKTAGATHNYIAHIREYIALRITLLSDNILDVLSSWYF